MDDFKERFLSRKFLLVVATIVFFVIQTLAGSLSEADAADAIWKIVLGYLGAEGAADVVTRLREPKPVDPVQ